MEQDIRQMAEGYLAKMEERIKTLQTQLEQATINESRAEIRAASAEAKLAECEKEEEACEMRLRECEAQLAQSTARAAALDSSLAAERLARIEADKRTTAMAAELKKTPTNVIQTGKESTPVSYRLVVTGRDMNERIQQMEIVPTSGGGR